MTVLLTPNEVIDQLRLLPSQLASVLAERPAASSIMPDSGAWSPAEVFAHIRASNDVLAMRAYMVLARDHPPLPALDERRWTEVAGYAQMDVLDSLETYSRQRAELVHMLTPLPHEAWQRTGLHEQRGGMTLFDLLTMLVEHEKEHLAQLEASRV